MDHLEASQSQDAGDTSAERWFAAIKERQYDFIMAELATFKCTINERGNTALIEAVLIKDEPAIQILAAHEFGCQTPGGKMALEVAYETGFVGACDILARFELSRLHSNGIFLCHRAVLDGNLSMVRSLASHCINIIQPSTNQTPLDIAIQIPSADSIIEQLVNTSTITLETLDKACKTASESQSLQKDQAILELLLAFRNAKEAHACSRCALLRKQLMYLAAQFHDLYSRLSRSADDVATENADKQGSSSPEEGELTVYSSRRHRSRDKGLNAKLPRDPSRKDAHSNADQPDNTALSFSLTRNFNQLRNMLPNASFDLTIDESILTKLLDLSRAMRSEIHTLRMDNINKTSMIERLQANLADAQQIGAGKQAEIDEDNMEITIKPRVESRQSPGKVTKGATPQSIITKVNSSSEAPTAAVKTSTVAEPNEMLLSEAMAAIKAKDLYINFLLDENGELRKGIRKAGATDQQDMVVSQQEQITHLINLLYQSKSALEKMSELEIQCNTLQDDNKILRQQISNLQQARPLASPSEPSSAQVKRSNKGTYASGEPSPLSSYHNATVSLSIERIKKLESTIKSLCAELDHQKLHSKELEDTIENLEATKSHIEMLKEKVLEQQSEIKRLNDVIGVQQNYLEIKDIELSKASKRIRELMENPKKPSVADGSLVHKAVSAPELAARAGPPHGSPCTPGGPVKRALKRSNSSRPNTTAVDEHKMVGGSPANVRKNDHAQPVQPGRALSAYVGHRTGDADITIDDLESTPTPVERVHRQEPQAQQQAQAQMQRQRRVTSKQSKAITRASASAATSLAARQALGISMPANSPTEAAPLSGQPVSRSAGTNSKTGITKLMTAAMHGDLITAKAYIKQDIGAQDAEGRSALFYAASNNHANIVRELVGREALLSTNKKYKDGAGVTALMVAAQEGHKSCIQLLYRQEKDCRTISGKGCTDFARNDLILRFMQSLALKQK